MAVFSHLCLNSLTILPKEISKTKKKEAISEQASTEPTQEEEKVEEPVEETEESATTTETQNTDTENARKLALTFQVYTGAVYFAHEGWGGQIGTDLMMGSKTIAGTPLFIGGSIGYRAKILADKTYSFIPLQVVLAMPLVKKQHSPHISVSMGYGFLTDKTYKGGLCLSASAGWSYQFNTNSSLLLGAYADLQQTKTNVTETINNQEYTSFKASSFVSIGATIGIKF